MGILCKGEGAVGGDADGDGAGNLGVGKGVGVRRKSV